MPFTEDHWLITVQGDAWLSTETWQFGVRAALAAGGGEANAQALANALAAPTQAFFQDASMAISNRVRLLSIKVAHVLTTGLYPTEFSPGIYTYPTPVVGPSTAATYPQITMACTLHTDKARGRASKGRFYLPPHGMSVGTDGRLPVASAEAVETAAKAWLDAIKGTLEVSQILVMSKLGTGTTATVTGVSCGRVVDTMRSRRRALDEGVRSPAVLTP